MATFSWQRWKPARDERAGFLRAVADRDCGVRLAATQLVTCSMLGTLRNNAETRSEFLRLCGTT